MKLSLYKKFSDSNSSKYLNLVEILIERAQTQSDRIAYTFLQDGESQAINLTYQLLDRRARAIAARLQTLCHPGERALLLYRSGLDFIEAFFGCLYAGVVAIPAYPPRNNKNISRLETIIKDANPKTILTVESLSNQIQIRLAKNNQLTNCLNYIATDTVPEAKSSLWRKTQLSRDTLAFLQYTSGSTGTPKGVMVTHGNIMQNLAVIELCFGHTLNSKGLIWLPSYYDMGLIGGILQPLFVGFPVVLMSPIHFIQKPIRWLQGISQYKATTSGGPNFAYQLCIDKIKPEQLVNLDLSSWEVAFIGAEPIRHQTLDRFARIFASRGFSKKAFYPCYGMAENTLFISGGFKKEPPIVNFVNRTELSQNKIISRSEDDLDRQAIVSCGRSWSEQKIAIVNPETLTPCKDLEVGEIWVSGASVAKGYWQKPELTQQTFNACIPNTTKGPFLRTGDLGFLQNDELFLTGRIKDLIIIDGCNHYPQDIEQTVENSHPAIVPNNLAAFSVDIDGLERLIVIAEVKRTYRRNDRSEQLKKAIASIRAAISQNHQIGVHSILLLKFGTIPKTSSGKIQRHACRNAFLQENFKEIALLKYGTSRP